MDFGDAYSRLRNQKFNCNITGLFGISKIMFGSGGSDNISLAVTNKDGDQMIVKIIPEIIFINTKIKPDQNQLEIKFYQFFTNKYILTDRTPHIVGIYNHQNCSRIDKLLRNIKPTNKVCPTYTDKLTRKLKLDRADEIICDLLLRYQMKLIGSVFDVCLLEYCQQDFSKWIRQSVTDIKKAPATQADSVIESYLAEFHRILFQIIFTIAIIKLDYPGFMHGDMFVRNILLQHENKYHSDDYVAYYYRQKIFYLQANGPYAKINDFGMSVIVNKLEFSTYKLNAAHRKIRHENPFNPKSDIFNLLHDIYNGQNLGTTSITKLADELLLPESKLKPIVGALKKFIRTNTIDRINKINRKLLNRTWNIDKLEILENTVLTPDQYLMQTHFDMFRKIPPNANIIRHFNKPSH